MQHTQREISSYRRNAPIHFTFRKAHYFRNEFMFHKNTWHFSVLFQFGFSFQTRKHAAGPKIVKEDRLFDQILKLSRMELSKRF